MKLTAIDLFCGAGGFSKGMENAGIDVIYGIDINSQFEKTFNYNHKNTKFLCYDISKRIPEIIKTHKYKIDIIFGSPPCQGFSDARGNRDPKNKDQKHRNNLPFQFIKYVKDLQPKIYIMENVTGMSTFKINNCNFMNILKEKFNEISYTFTWKIINSAKFGVPQIRKRIICIGIPNNTNINITIPTCDSQQKYKNKILSVKDAFSKLNYKTVKNHQILKIPTNTELKIIKRIDEGKTYRSSRFGQNYIGVWSLFENILKKDEQQLLHFLCKKRTNKKYKQNKGKHKEGYLYEKQFPTDKNGRLYWSEKYSHNKNHRPPHKILNDLIERGWLRLKEFKNIPAYDINTKSGIRPLYKRLSTKTPSPTIMTTSFNLREFIHPIENRPITLREGAKLQSFSDSFIFYGTPRNIAIQIGNAVPPLLAEEIGIYITTLFKDIER